MSLRPAIPVVAITDSANSIEISFRDSQSMLTAKITDTEGNVIAAFHWNAAHHNQPHSTCFLNVQSGTNHFGQQIQLSGKKLYIVIQP